MRGVLFTGFFVALLLRMTEGSGRFVKRPYKGWGNVGAIHESPVQGRRKPGRRAVGRSVYGILRRFAPQNDRGERAMRRISRTI